MLMMKDSFNLLHEKEVLTYFIDQYWFEMQLNDLMQ